MTAVLTAFLIVLGVVVGFLLAVVFPWLLLRKLQRMEDERNER